MFKKSLMLFTALVTLWSVQSICQAEILPPHGPGQIGYSSVVLCENLGAHKEPSADSEVTETLHGDDDADEYGLTGEDYGETHEYQD